MKNELRFCPCGHSGKSSCKECTINEQFNVGHLKILYIQYLPVVDVCSDVVDTLIFWLIEVSGSVNDLILKIFKSIDGSFIGWRHGIRYLDISSKKALFHANIRDVRDNGFSVVVPKPIYDVDETYRCWLVLLPTNTIVEMDWKFCDLLSHSMHFCFDFMNIDEYVGKRNAKVLM
jgi:hypothetical protein